MTDGWPAPTPRPSTRSSPATARIQASRPTALRRLVLYQLLRLLQAAPSGPTEHRARELGVDQEEAKALAHAADRAPRWTPDARAAAEEILDAWRTKRVRQAFDCAASARRTGPGRRAGPPRPRHHGRRPADRRTARPGRGDGTRRGTGQAPRTCTWRPPGSPSTTPARSRSAAHGADPQRRLTTHLVRGACACTGRPRGPHRVMPPRGRPRDPWTELAAHAGRWRVHGHGHFAGDNGALRGDPRSTAAPSVAFHCSAQPRRGTPRKSRACVSWSQGQGERHLAHRPASAAYTSNAWRQEQPAAGGVGEERLRRHRRAAAATTAI
ncbi:hypothetical protein ACRAWF_17450 [Streptomyces sp. L7]